MFLEKGHGPTGLGGDQPGGDPLLLESLDQFSELAELVRIGRDGAAGEIEAVRMGVLLQQFRQIEAFEALRRAESLVDIPVQQTRPETVPIPIVQAPFRGHLVVMFTGMVEPLLPVGETVTAFVDDDEAVHAEVVEQRCRFLPGEPHQASHPLRCAPIQQQINLLLLQQTIQTLGHPFAQSVGDQRAETGGCQLQLIDRIKGALAGGVELSELVELLPEELQAHRQLAADGKHINDVAPPAPGPFLVDRGDAFVAQPGEGLPQVLEIHLISPPQDPATL